jgi:DNA-binding response OmpR family regulator
LNQINLQQSHLAKKKVFLTMSMVLGNNTTQKPMRMPLPRIILVVETDTALRKAIALLLRREGHVVLALADPTLALEIAHENPLSLIIVDFQSDSQHLSFCQQLQAPHELTHVPLLLVLQNEHEIVQIEQQGLHADDYVLAPLTWEELRACTRTLLRTEKHHTGSRSTQKTRRREQERSQEHQERFLVEDLVVDPISRTVSRQGHPIEITSPVLFDLLAYLACRPGIVVTRQQLLEQVWGYNQLSMQSVQTRTVDVHVHWLRELIGDDSVHPHLIQTVRGFGYRFKALDRE